MIFSTYQFVFLFLPLVFASYTTCLRAGRIHAAKWILVISSLIFYAYGSGNFFPFFVLSVAFNYMVGKYLGRQSDQTGLLNRRLVLTGGLLGNILLLGHYKYTDFIIFNFNFLFDTSFPYRNILLPIGISFFTFQLIAYLVDSYRGETRDYSILNYLLFITFFPQLIVGPIVHHKDVVPQYDRIDGLFPDYEKLSRGTFLFAMGCAKKLILADPLSGWAQKAFEAARELNCAESWCASLSYTLSYYFDLSGYADMAIGLGLIFGIAIPINFNSPYKSRNFAEYWRRWHMTLSRFLGDYIFRSVYRKNGGSNNFYFAIFATFMVSGFWHGAGWTFVLWGCVNGLFVIFSHMMTRAGRSLPFGAAWALTFAGIVGTRILFVSDSFADALHVMATLFDFESFSLAGSAFIPVKAPLYIVAGMIIACGFPNSNQILDGFKPNFRFAVLSSSLIVLSLLNMSNTRGFLYFQF